MGNLGLAVIVITILFAANHSTAIKKSNSRTTSFLQAGNNININSSMHDHYRLVEDDVAHAEFFLNLKMAMNSLSLLPVFNCGRGKSYTPCVPNLQNSKIVENCHPDNLYNRGCRK
ncbi:hypothetical protein OWV82_020813 [Melia azedarach]|uniref:Uncharacterized protein n=1 Tax=Melia azedarach TaxID=155640 RepID=A0ACC1X9A2_MELAZ|nr:hypothetical protein OWV82_020813 [Melia azedarach]